MGGSGSSRWGGERVRATTDSRGQVTAPQARRGRGPPSLVGHVEAMPQPFGGYHFYLRCPLCRRRCRVLYSARPDPFGWAVAIGREEFYACRQCQSLAYRSQRLTREQRLLSKARKHRLRVQPSTAVYSEDDALAYERSKGVHRQRWAREVGIAYAFELEADEEWMRTASHAFSAALRRAGYDRRAR